MFDWVCSLCGWVCFVCWLHVLKVWIYVWLSVFIGLTCFFATACVDCVISCLDLTAWFSVILFPVISCLPQSFRSRRSEVSNSRAGCVISLDECVVRDVLCVLCIWFGVLIVLLHFYSPLSLSPYTFKKGFSQLWNTHSPVCMPNTLEFVFFCIYKEVLTVFESFSISCFLTKQLYTRPPIRVSTHSSPCSSLLNSVFIVSVFFSIRKCSTTAVTSSRSFSSDSLTSSWVTSYVFPH